MQELFDIAKRALTDEKTLKASQVTVLWTSNHCIYTAIDDLSGAICEELALKKDTRILKLITIWKNGQIDLPSLRFRQRMIALNENNKDTDMILQGKDGYIIKKVSQTMS
ncbi:MAG: hypothetical protein IJN34_02375 [Clostridia bacterium]|nr:hypothetical protein [Clostridia bacterium]